MSAAHDTQLALTRSSLCSYKYILYKCLSFVYSVQAINITVSMNDQLVNTYITNLIGVVE